MPHSLEDYRRSLMNLMPKGRFWSRSPDSVFSQFWNAIAEEFIRIEERAEDLQNESIVTTSSELIEDYEEDYDIDGTGTDAQRRSVILARKLAVGENLDDYFVEIAESLGFTITISQYNPGWVGVITVGDNIGSQSLVFQWVVFVDIERDRLEYDAAFDGSFDRRQLMDKDYFLTLTNTNLTDLVTQFATYKQAHARPVYKYSNIEYDRSFNMAFNATPFWDEESPLPDFNLEWGDGFTNHRTYTGIHLVGGYTKAFGLGFDSYNGGGWDHSPFSTDFRTGTGDRI